MRNRTFYFWDAMVGAALMLVVICLIAIFSGRSVLAQDSWSSSSNEVQTGKTELELRGFTLVRFLNAKTDGDSAFDDSLFTYSGNYKSCPLRLVYNSNNGLVSYITGGGQFASMTFSDVSVKSIDALKRPNLANC